MQAPTTYKPTAADLHPTVTDRRSQAAAAAAEVEEEVEERSLINILESASAGQVDSTKGAAPMQAQIGFGNRRPVKISTEPRGMLGSRVEGVGLRLRVEG